MACIIEAITGRSMARRVPKPGELYCWQCGKLGRDVVKMPDGVQLCRACQSR